MFDLVSLIKTAGYLGIFGIVFAESGLLVGFIFPGDSLLFTAGFLASQDLLSIWVLMPLTISAAIMGDSFGYAFGKKIGPRIFTSNDSLFFDKAHIERAQEFFNKYGKKTIILARFLPVVRTFAPILAGVGHMQYRVFLSYNIVGGLLWGGGLTLLGYFLGEVIPDVDSYLLPVILVIVVISVLPTVIHLLRDQESRRGLLVLLGKLFDYFRKR